MKRVIRTGVFETNSSSTHSLTITSDEEFQMWIDGKVFWNRNNDEFIDCEQAINDTNEELKTSECCSDGEWYDLKEYDEREEDYTTVEECAALYNTSVINIMYKFGYFTYDYFMSEWDRYETFEQRYTTKNGDKVVAFGYYGNSW